MEISELSCLQATLSDFVATLIFLRNVSPRKRKQMWSRVHATPVSSYEPEPWISSTKMKMEECRYKGEEVVSSMKRSTGLDVTQIRSEESKWEYQGENNAVQMREGGEYTRINVIRQTGI